MQSENENRSAELHNSQNMRKKQDWKKEII